IQRGCNLHSDGRPIIGLDSQKLLNIVMESDPSALFVPAHIWTPWFSVFGSKSGFDSLEEVFGEDVKYIHALETGLSSDPLMNWRLSALDKYALISNSDAHSPNNFGREANVFDIELSYENLINAIKSKDPSKFLYTIEFYPEEGMYHFDGHRACQVRFSPEETKEYKKICPVCGKLLTIGVLSRVGDLADRPLGFQPKETIPFKRLVPLKEIIAEVLGVKGKTKKVEALYNDLINNFENEFNILLNVDIKNISSFSGEKLAEALKRVREGQLVINPGYDGEYGEVKIFNQDEIDSDTFSVN
ncbi:MAG: endonuclease Q family protein, partial [Candidatus Parcubacteria bacterium]|nr:endonuclease Q family protein [Candidatus Parcubacteria bacterium]